MTESLNPLPIAVGQTWKMRCGKTATVTTDRRVAGSGGESLRGSERWSWALSNGRMVDACGREDYGGSLSPYDLIELVRT